MGIIANIIRFFYKSSDKIKRKDLIRYLDRYYPKDTKYADYYGPRIHVRDKTTRENLYSLLKSLKRTHLKFSGMRISRMSKDEMFDLLYREIYQ